MCAPVADNCAKTDAPVRDCVRNVHASERSVARQASTVTMRQATCALAAAHVRHAHTGQLAGYDLRARGAALVADFRSPSRWERAARIVDHD
jgi:hypothetical protein